MNLAGSSYLWWSLHVTHDECWSSWVLYLSVILSSASLIVWLSFKNQDQTNISWSIVTCLIFCRPRSTITQGWPGSRNLDGAGWVSWTPEEVWEQTALKIIRCKLNIQTRLIKEISICNCLIYFLQYVSFFIFFQDMKLCMCRVSSELTLLRWTDMWGTDSRCVSATVDVWIRTCHAGRLGQRGCSFPCWIYALSILETLDERTNVWLACFFLFPYFPPYLFSYFPTFLLSFFSLESFTLLLRKS